MCCWTSLSCENHGISCRCVCHNMETTTTAYIPSQTSAPQSPNRRVRKWTCYELDVDYTLFTVAWISNHLRSLSCTVISWWKARLCFFFFEAANLWRRCQTWTFLQWKLRPWPTDQACWWMKLILDVVGPWNCPQLSWAMRDISRYKSVMRTDATVLYTVECFLIGARERERESCW